jgi:MFS family permease
MKRLLIVAFIFHLAGILLTIFAGGYWTLFISTLCIGIANGTVEAACNPLVATIYSDDKTTKLNHFHLWFPGGIVIGTLIVYFLDKAGVGWQVQVGLMAIPTLFMGCFSANSVFLLQKGWPAAYLPVKCIGHC